jgi:glucosamine--fructose-6-phosphate aminotransferase (isomerizing)
MNIHDARYQPYSLVREMMETAEVVRRFGPSQTAEVAGQVKAAGRLLLTGEGSSRLFPAKNAIRKALTWGLDLQIITEGSLQAATYDLSQFAVFMASNSGKTREVILLARQLAAAGHELRFGLTAHAHAMLEDVTRQCWVLGCGGEEACAATKSVFEQALFHQSLLSHVAGRDMRADLAGLDEKVTGTLNMAIDPAIVEKACGATTIYLAGYNDGVAEELALKTNEITRKKSDFLEGTYVVHGIEEVMEKNDLVILVDPIESELAKFQTVLEKGVGLSVVAIADRPTPFATIQVPRAGEMTPYLYLCAGWNLLVEIGLRLGVNLDKPQRARKVGKEFVGV